MARPPIIKLEMVQRGVTTPGPGKPSIAWKIGDFIRRNTSITIFTGSPGGELQKTTKTFS